MSAVINKAKQQYAKALKIEIGVIFTFFCLLMLLKVELSVSFLAGCLASFFPHCVFVYWIFFRHFAKNQKKVTAFYCGEGMKWLVAIVLIIASLILIPNLCVLAFFAGYFFALLLNIVLPIVLNRHTSSFS